MEESFLNKINTHWNKGWNSNPNYAKAARFMDIVSKGENEKEALKKQEIEELEL